MDKGFSAKGFTGKATGVSPRIASVSGSSAKARVNKAAGQKVAGVSGVVIAPSKATLSRPVAVASGDAMVMPVSHPSAKTTRTVTKGGTL